MVFFLATFKAALEGISAVNVNAGCRWKLTLRDPKSGETKEAIWVDAEDEVDIPGSKGVANFVMKWKDSGASCNVNVVAHSDVVSTYEGGDEVAFACFECRGCEIVAWHVEADQFVAVSDGGVEFGEADLTEDWAEYDEEHEMPVEISDIETAVVTAKASGKKGGGKKKKKKKK